MKLLICNAGSTSLKFKLYDMPRETALAVACVERVGSETDAIYRFEAGSYAVSDERACVPGYREGVERFLEDLSASGVARRDEIGAVGFKTVLAMGYPGVHEIGGDVKRALADSLCVAPAHNRAYLDAIEVIERALPGARRIGSFETAFHTTIPPANRLYGVPYEWYERYGVQKMGYHGASHAYIAARLGAKHRRVLSCHLGGSGSLCAIVDGQSVDNSFGLSLQAGPFHNNRAGDIDPYIIAYMVDRGMPFEDVMASLTKKSGLLGVSGVSGDLRKVTAAADAGNERAKLALDMYVVSVVRYVGAYALEMGGLDAIAFTGGIGERSAYIRGRVCEAARPLGVTIDKMLNEENAAEIAGADSRVAVYVIPADEEIMVARNAYRFLQG